MTSTKTRRPARTATPRPAVITPTGRLAELTADHDHAYQAAAAPDVAHEMHVHASRTALALGLNPSDRAVVNRLLDLARGSYIHGHMDATAEHTTTLTPLATALHLHGGAS